MIIIIYVLFAPFWQCLVQPQKKCCTMSRSCDQAHDILHQGIKGSILLIFFVNNAERISIGGLIYANLMGKQFWGFEVNPKALLCIVSFANRIERRCCLYSCWQPWVAFYGRQWQIILFSSPYYYHSVFREEDNIFSEPAKLMFLGRLQLTMVDIHRLRPKTTGNAIQGGYSLIYETSD